MSTAGGPACRTKSPSTLAEVVVRAVVVAEFPVADDDDRGAAVALAGDEVGGRREFVDHVLDGDAHLAAVAVALAPRQSRLAGSPAQPIATPRWPCLNGRPQVSLTTTRSAAIPSRMRAALSEGRSGSSSRSPSGTFDWSIPALTPMWPKRVAVRRNGASMISSVDSSMTACAKRGSFSSPAISASRSATPPRALARREVREVEGPPLRLGDDRAGDDDHVALAEVDALVDHGRQIVSVPDLGRPGTANSSIRTGGWRRGKTPPVPGRFDGIRFWGGKWVRHELWRRSIINRTAVARASEWPTGHEERRARDAASDVGDRRAPRGTPRAMWATEESAARGTPRAMWATEERRRARDAASDVGDEESAARGTPRAMWATEESPERAARLGRCEVAVLCGRGGTQRGSRARLGLCECSPRSRRSRVTDRP